MDRPRRRFRKQRNLISENKFVNNAAKNAVLNIGMSVKQINGPNDPPPVQNTITVTYKGYFIHNSAPTGTPVTVADIMAAVPGGSVTWNKVRVFKASIWGNATAANGWVGLRSSAGGSEIKTFRDYGVVGARRPAVHLRLDREIAEYYYDGTATSQILVAYGSTDQTSALIGFTCELVTGTNVTF